MDFDDYQKWQDDLLRTMREPLHEVERFKGMYDDLMRPFKQFEELMESPFQREFKRYQEQQKLLEQQMHPVLGDINALKAVSADVGMPPYRHLEKFMEPVQRELRMYEEQQKSIEQQMRPLLGDINALKAITAGIGMQPALSFFDDYRKAMEALRVPPGLQEAVDVIRGGYDKSLLMPRDIEQMLAGLVPYAAVVPAAPSGEMLDAIRRRVDELRETSAERISEGVAAIMRWLLANAGRLDRKTVSFVIFTVIYPLVLTIYQPDIQRAVRPRQKEAQRKLEGQIVRVVAERVPAPGLKNLRYVSIDALIMRSAARKDSSRVATLHFGDVVVAVRATKDWTYVEYRFEDAQVHGWVYTRYLRRFPSSG